MIPMRGQKKFYQLSQEEQSLLVLQQTLRTIATEEILQETTSETQNNQILHC